MVRFGGAMQAPTADNRPAQVAGKTFGVCMVPPWRWHHTVAAVASESESKLQIRYETAIRDDVNTEV